MLVFAQQIMSQRRWTRPASTSRSSRSPRPGPGATVNPTSPNASVLLIGASRGLGHAIAAEYLDRGARVVATVRGRGHTPLHDLAGTAGGRLEIEHADINDPAQVGALRDRLRHQLAGRTFDLLFVNAGVTQHDPE